MCINLALTFAYAGNFTWRYKTYAHRAPVSAGMLALPVACVAGLGMSGYLGGKLTYRYGVRVAERTQAEGYLTDTELAAGHRAQRSRPSLAAPDGTAAQQRSGGAG